MQELASHSHSERMLPAHRNLPEGTDESLRHVRRAAEGAAATAQRSRVASTFWKIWLPIPVLFILLDCVFNLFFWRIPKLSGPGADWGYQFLIDMHRLHVAKPAGAVRVVAFGSSVSAAFDPYQVESLLRSALPATPLEVHRLMLPGIHPSDYHLLWEAEAERARPDVAVILFNLLDFLSSGGEHDTNPTLHAALPPWRTLVERGATLPVTDQLEWGLDGVSNLYRYRKVIRSSLQDHLKAGAHWLKSRSPQAGYGVYADGYTKQHFGFRLDGKATTDVEYYVHPEWIRQRGQVALRFSVGRTTLAQSIETQPGWKTVHLTLPAGNDRVVHVAADSVWNPRAGGVADDVRLLGLQLRGPLLADAGNGHAAPYRYPPFEDGVLHEFLRMGDASAEQFAQKWREVLESNTAFGKRFRFYRDAKLRVRTDSFRPSGEYSELARLVEQFSQRGTKVVLINTPESPWILKEYQDSQYYRDYLAFFQKLAQKPGVEFVDLRSALPPEDFNDWHHPTYIGEIKLGPTFAGVLRDVIAKAEPTRVSLH